MGLIGDGKLSAKIEAMPGEAVLFDGGAAPGGAIIRTVRISLLIVFVASLFILIAILPRKPAKCTAQASDARSVAEPSIPGAAAHSGRNLALVIIATVAGMLTVAAYADSAARTRNAWYVITTERICIQGGGFGRHLGVIDLDKVVSVQAVASWLQRKWGLHSIHFTQAGATVFVQNNGHPFAYNPYVVDSIPSDSDLLSRLLNEWLPRDNRRTT